ncbi:hypothetical protein DL96DRAFT_1454259 [Flagelloscypha sp. PMI_526]|nr:hypothetical protein DL96DRAFT_1454259 [Flagelloscypha sp. PMI_526]
MDAQQHNQAMQHDQMYYYVDDSQYTMPYSPGGHPQYPPHAQIIQHPQPRVDSIDTDIPHQHSSLQYQNVMVPQQQTHQTYQTYNAASPPRGQLPLPPSASPPPPSPTNLYDPLSPTLSGSETSGEGLYHHSNSSGALSAASSPSSSRGSSLVHRNRTTHRYDPTPSPTGSSSTRRAQRARSQDSDELDDEGMGVNYRDNLASTRKEATRRQRIEAEQRRRDELRDGYAKLKDVLPVSNLKSSKVSLLERATNHIIALEKQNRELQDRIEEMEQEAARLRTLNERMTLGTAGDVESANLLDMKSDPMSPGLVADDGSSPQTGLDEARHASSIHQHRASPSPSTDSAY